MFGGVVAAIGLVGSFFTQNIFHLMATLGIISAVGMGFAFTPSIIILHHYFEKRFVVANGIAFAGISCGELVFSLILPPMIDAYGWQGALLIMAAVELNLVVCGGVMILPYPPSTTVNFKTTSDGYDSASKRKPETPNIQSLSKNIDKDKRNKTLINTDDVDSGLFNNGLVENDEPDEAGFHRRLSSYMSSQSSVYSSSSSSFEPRPRFLSEPRKTIALFMFGLPDKVVIEEHETDSDSEEVLSGELVQQRPRHSIDMIDGIIIVRDGKDNWQTRPRAKTTGQSLLSRPKDETLLSRPRGHTMLAVRGHSMLSRPRGHSVLSASGRSLFSRPRGQSVLSQHSIVDPSYSVIKELKHESFLITRPLRNPYFLVMLPIMLLHGIGWYAVITHLIPFAVEFGYADKMAFDLLSLIAIGSLIGCLTHGWFIDKNMISSEFAKIISLTLLTIITLVYPAAHYSYPALAVLSFLYGIAAGVSLPLFFALIRNLLPPEDVNAGVSLVIITEMLGDTIGGVCAGRLYDKTHDYEISFFFAGGALLASTLLQLGLSWFKRRSKVREEHTYKFGDVELAPIKTGFKDRVTRGNPVPKTLAIESHERKTRGTWGSSNGNI
ncbi:uncharacterized protein [Amphiura filiformis]|uniref:uncharacterized protein n=1 Tax=Amphiura filiformis TaxID=82378 RepID=UPI003B20D567